MELYETTYVVLCHLSAMCVANMPVLCSAADMEWRDYFTPVFEGSAKVTAELREE
jgi:hypothetical protein